jgi:ABC-2 type transport system permease protein
MSTQDNPFDGLDSALSAADGRMRDTFGWYTVAKKEFRDASRSKGLWLLTVVFVSVFILPVVLALYFGIDLVSRGGSDIGMQLLISTYYLNVVTILLPIIAIFVGYAAIAKERTSGSLKLLLSLPNSRQDVVLGKVFGRCAVVAVPLAISLGLGALFFAASRITLKPDIYFQFSLFTLAFTVVFVAIAVSISGAFSTTTRSGVANFLVYFYLTFGWNGLVNGLGSLLTDYLGLGGSVRWHAVLFAKLLNPNQAYKTLTNSMLGQGPLSARFGMFSQGGLLSSGLSNEALSTICGPVLGGSASVQEGQLGSRIICEGTAPAPYFSDVAVFLYMFVWVGVAAVISYKTFNLADL